MRLAAHPLTHENMVDLGRVGIDFRVIKSPALKAQYSKARGASPDPYTHLFYKAQ
jgi:hypothetical protein